MFFMTVGSSLFLENTSSSEPSKLHCCYENVKVGVLHFFLLKALFIFLLWVLAGKQNQFLSASVAGRVALHKFNRYFICVGKHTQKYQVSHYDELPETRDRLLADRQFNNDNCSYINRFDCNARGPG